MVSLPQQFSVDDPNMQSSGGVVHIPDGLYKAICVESDLKPTQKGGQYLMLRFVITEGQHANTELIERLNVVNENPKAVEIAYKTLVEISGSLGMAKTPQESNELHNKPLLIKVETEKGTKWTDNEGTERDGKDKSVIKGYKPIGTPVAAAPQAASAPATAPFASGGGAPPAWAAKQ